MSDFVLGVVIGTGGDFWLPIVKTLPMVSRYERYEYTFTFVSVKVTTSIVLKRETGKIFSLLFIGSSNQ